MMFCLRTAPKRFAPKVWAASSIRTNTTIAETVYYRCNYHDKAAAALACPHEKVKWSYEELWKQITSLAGGLKALGYQQGDVIATDCSSVGNVLLQLAVAHNGMQVMPVKDAAEFEQLARMVPVRGAVMANKSSFLSKTSLSMTSSIADIKGKAPEGNTDRRLPLAYYNTADVTTNRELYQAGVGLAGLLEITPDDTVCIATSTNKVAGMGSVVSAFVRNATVYIPDMANLDLADTTLLITDEAALETVRKAKTGSKLRGGLVQVNGGEEVLWATEEVGGVKLRILGAGSKSEVMRPLFDSCKDTYYSFK